MNLKKAAPALGTVAACDKRVEDQSNSDRSRTAPLSALVTSLA